MVTLALSIVKHARIVVTMTVAVVIRGDSQYFAIVRRRGKLDLGQYLVGDISANMVT